MKKIEAYLSQKALVSNVSTLDELGQHLTAAREQRRTLNLMMGQTFDNGQPVDMMKYALSIMNLSDVMQNAGVAVKSNWLIADHFVVNINNDERENEAGEQAKQRIAYLQRLNEVYRSEERRV